MDTTSNLTDYEAYLDAFGPSSFNHFDFTPLFENTILSILPSAFLLLILPFRLMVLHDQPRKVSWSVLYGSKLVCQTPCTLMTIIALFTALQAGILILYVANSKVRTVSTISTTILAFVDALGLCFLSHAEHIRSVHPSIIINAYLFITIIFDIARTRSLWIQDAPTSIAVVCSIAIGVKLCLAVAEAVEKRRILLSPYRNTSPETTSSIYNQMVFWWLNNLIYTGSRRTIQSDDLFTLEDEGSSKVLQDRGQNLWDLVDQDHRYALFWSTLNANRLKLALCILPRLFLIGFRYSQPFLLTRTVEFIKSSTDSNNVGWGLTGAFAVVFLGIAASSGFYYHMTFRFVTSVRGTLVSMIYAKTVSLSIIALDESAAITLMSNDTETICAGFESLHELWAVPIELALAMWLLQRQIGLSFLAPAAVAIISAACTMFISKYIGGSQKIWNRGIQLRVDVTASMLSSIKAVKVLGLTDHICSSLQGLRVEELRLAKLFRRLLCASAFFSNNMRVLAPFVTFVVLVIIERPTSRELSASSAFTTLSLISMLAGPVGTFLRTIPLLHSAMACFDRIQSFLVSQSKGFYLHPLESPPDLHSFQQDALVVESPKVLLQAPQDMELQDHDKPRQQHPDPLIIKVENASFSWRDNGPPIIDDVTFSIQRSNFVFIVGPVGCGKSTLLKGLMGEVPFQSGFVYSGASDSAFMDQTPWIQNTTIQRNIIGPANFDSSWYEEVIRACSLESDILRMPNMHSTIVGSRGISLSGGQKQRVALARAVYARKSLISIDDGFSGLDADTEEKVFSRVFGKQGLLRKSGTTVLLVTNAAHRLPYSDYIIALNASGHITEHGTFDMMKGAGGYVSELTTKHKYAEELPTSDGDAIDVRSLDTSLHTRESRIISPINEDINRAISELSTYKYYFASIGWVRSLLSLFYLVISGVSVKLTELLITYWTSAITTEGNRVNSFYISMFGMLAGIGTIMWNVASYHYFLSVVPSSAEKLHAELLHTVMNAPLHFFASTDTGTTINRMLSRFSQDMSVVDKELPFALIDLIVAVVQAFMGAVLMCLAAGYFALIMPPVIFVVWCIQKYYLRTSRQVRLLDLEAKSPLYSHFIESLSGLVTIRAFGWSHQFVQQNQVLLDKSQKPYYLLFCIQRWLSLVLDLLVAVLAIILMVLVVKLRNSVTAGYVGLALLNVMNFSQSLAWVVRQWTSLETSIGAVSRLKNFTTLVPNENLAGENKNVSSDWPAHGAIAFKNLSASYTSGGRPILEEINLSIKPGEKIGICGHTGSGKSSLIMTLFRLLEVSPTSSIMVDNIELTTLPRQLIRSRFNGVPQETFVMKGTIRQNLSPNGHHTEEEVIQALKKVELWGVVEAKGGIDTESSPDYFSHGQLQLFCLARALLRKSKIVILDEISSSIDVETDKLVQRVIREDFAGATILSIAHRLETILDFDRLALLKDGKLVEFDTPEALLGRSSAFKALYES